MLKLAAPSHTKNSCFIGSLCVRSPKQIPSKCLNTQFWTHGITNRGHTSTRRFMGTNHNMQTLEHGYSFQKWSFLCFFVISPFFQKLSNNGTSAWLGNRYLTLGTESHNLRFSRLGHQVSFSFVESYLSYSLCKIIRLNEMHVGLMKIGEVNS